VDLRIELPSSCLSPLPLRSPSPAENGLESELDGLLGW